MTFSITLEFLRIGEQNGSELNKLQCLVCAFPKVGVDAKDLVDRLLRVGSGSDEESASFTISGVTTEIEKLLIKEVAAFIDSEDFPEHLRFLRQKKNLSELTRQELWDAVAKLSIAATGSEFEQPTESPGEADPEVLRRRIQELLAHITPISAATKNRINGLLDTILETAEVSQLPRCDQSSVDPLPQKGSLLDKALEDLEREAEAPSRGKAVNSQYYKDLHEVALGALRTAQYLRFQPVAARSEVSPEKFLPEADVEYATRVADALSKHAARADNPEVGKAAEKPAEDIFPRDLRTLADESLQRPRSTQIATPFPIFVPGDRFREQYYWDTYFVIRGLCVAGHTRQAAETVGNMLSLIRRFGFIPNGTRTYYLDRSQPPVSSESVRVVVDTILNRKFQDSSPAPPPSKAPPTETPPLEEWRKRYMPFDASREEDAVGLLTLALPEMVREYFACWMNPHGGHLVQLDAKTKAVQPVQTEGFLADLLNDKSKNLFLNRYFSPLGSPRPESHPQDVAVTRVLHDLGESHKTAEILKSIRAAAESGWDFSSRWAQSFIEGKEGEATTKVDPFPLTPAERYFREIDTLEVLPVDLASFLYRHERNIMYFCKMLKRLYAKGVPVNSGLPRIDEKTLDTLRDIFKRLSERRLAAMQSTMWDPDQCVWRDFHTRTRQQSKVVSTAALVPGWAGVEPPAKNGRPRTENDYMEELSIPLSLLKASKGKAILPTGNITGQQWDAPNLWPPLAFFASTTSQGKPRKGLWGRGSSWRFGDVSAVSSEPNQTKIYVKGNGGTQQAADLAVNYLDAVRNGFSRTNGRFFEKYNGAKIGSAGGGGEYPTQVGFGWTIGVFLEMLARFNPSLHPDVTLPTPP